METLAHRRGWLLIAVPMLLALSSCGTGWAEVRGVTAGKESDTTIYVDYDICWGGNGPMPRAQVVESTAEVRVTAAVKAPGSEGNACLTLEQVVLAAPIGDRVVVDGRTGKRVTVQFTG